MNKDVDCQDNQIPAVKEGAKQEVGALKASYRWSLGSADTKLRSRYEQPGFLGLGSVHGLCRPLNATSARRVSQAREILHGRAARVVRAAFLSWDQNCVQVTVSEESQ